MTKLEQFKSLFPLKGVITQDIIDSAEINVVTDCIGALTLSSALGDNVSLLDNSRVSWGDCMGHPRIEDTEVSIFTEEGVSMMEVTSPMEVTFIFRGTEGIDYL